MLGVVMVLRLGFCGIALTGHTRCRAAWVRRVVGIGNGDQRVELATYLAGRAEHARVANQVAPGRRDDPDPSAQERDRLEHQVGATIRPGRRRRWLRAQGWAGRRNDRGTD